MAMKVSKSLSPFWYTPLSQKADGKDIENAARFRLRPLSGEEQNTASEGVEYDAERATISLTGKAVSYILSRSILEWENVDSEDGPLKCSGENYKWIPGRDRADIALHVYVESALSQEQEKN